jgi:glycosyltransferase involved in cell wall biosynthesis
VNLPQPRGSRKWLSQHVREFDVVLVLDVHSTVSVLGARPLRPPECDTYSRALGTLPATRERERALPVYLGQLHPIKRIDVLIEAFAQVRERCPHLGWLVRHGYETQRLRRVSASLPGS